VNSYPRLGARLRGAGEPRLLGRNRSACIRIPVTGSNPKAKRLEFRRARPVEQPVPGVLGDMMPGLDGIKNRIEPPTPIDKDLYELPPDEHADIPTVPGSLPEVLVALEADHGFLLEGGVFTEDLVETWIDYKRTNEIDPIRLRPHPHEFELYYDI
jgi:glutamine synthetase